MYCCQVVWLTKRAASLHIMFPTYLTASLELAPTSKCFVNREERWVSEKLLMNHRHKYLLHVQLAKQIFAPEKKVSPIGFDSMYHLPLFAFALSDFI